MEYFTRLQCKPGHTGYSKEKKNYWNDEPFNLLSLFQSFEGKLLDMQRTKD